MMRLWSCGIVIAVATGWLVAGSGPAQAIVGDAEIAAGMITRQLVLVRSSRGICSGTVLARDLVLTAAHCVRPNEKLEVRTHDKRRRYAVKDAATHPQFTTEQGTLPTRVDLALLKLATPLPDDTQPALLGRRPTTAGEAVLVAGYGRHLSDSQRITGQARMATLITLDRRLGSQLMLRDPMPQESARLGACSGDSGGPAFAIRDGLVIIGVVTAAPGTCGGLTVVTPIIVHYDWIIETARKLGSPLTQ
jgi:hypothetical protein